MFKRLLPYFFFLNSYICSSYGDEVIWKGKVNSDGIPTELIPLKIHDKYQIRVSGYINLGKWVQQGEKLANDACYEFGEKNLPTKQGTLKNSNNISTCDDKYHVDHIYLSKPFVAKQNRIFFWVYDTDYEDNNGAFELEVIHKSKL